MIYIACPYSKLSARGKRIALYACEAYACMQYDTHRAMCYAPLIYGADIEYMYSIEVWYEHCLRILSACDEIHVLMLDGWQESIGMQKEMQYAQGNSISIRYIACDGETFTEMKR